MRQSPQAAPSTSELDIGVRAPAIDASCRWPLLTMYLGAALWLFLSAVASLVASMSFHAPAMFADCAWLSYGRMAPLANNLLVYGFCLPAGWGAALWILARTGRTRLAQSILATVGAKLWNLGVLVGMIGILRGDGSGFERVEFPIYAGWLLLLGSILVSIAGLTTILNRLAAEMHPAQWFAGLGMLWFPWIYGTAFCFLQLAPLRGIAEGTVHWWFLAQLHVVLLALFGIATLFYFLPVLKQQPLVSRYLALFALGGYLICGGWIGVPLHAPVPAWMTALSRILSVALGLPLVALVLNLWPLRAAGAAEGLPESKYLRFGFRAFIAWTVCVVVLNGTALWKMSAFTLVEPALYQLQVQGFAVMLLLGAAYLILPRVAGSSLPFPSFARAHFWLASVGLLLVVIPLLVGGFRQGAQLADVQVPFTDVASGVLMPIRIASIGQLLLIVGHFLLPVNVIALMVVLARAGLKSFDNTPAGWVAATEGRA